jgi:hypothetical protein
MSAQSSDRGTFWRYVSVAFLTFIFIMATAGVLWSLNDDKARGAAIALAGAAATHLIKETQRLIATRGDVKTHGSK